MDKEIIVLRGVGGNFKSSVAREFNKRGYIYIPEGTRDMEGILDELQVDSTTDLTYAAKYIVTKAVLNAYPLESKFVSDRGIVDNALMNEFSKTILTHYKHTASKALTTKQAFNDECTMFNGFTVKNVLLRTTDKKFLKKIIDDSYDSRAMYFNSTDQYLQCQDIYTKFILDHYNNVYQFNLSEIPDCAKYSDDMNAFVNKLSERIFNKIYEE